MSARGVEITISRGCIILRGEMSGGGGGGRDEILRWSQRKEEEEGGSEILVSPSHDVLPTTPPYILSSSQGHLMDENKTSNLYHFVFLLFWR